MTTLRKKLIKIIYETVKNTPTVDEDVKANLEHINQIATVNKEKFNNLEKWLLKEIPKFLKESFDPKYISSGIRVPLEVKVYFTSRPNRTIKIEKSNGIPYILVYFDSIFTKFNTKVNNQINTSKITEVDEKVRNIYNKTIDYSQLKEEMRQKAETVLANELEKSGFSFKKRENSSQMWALIDLDNTNESDLAPEYVELYRELKSIYY